MLRGLFAAAPCMLGECVMRADLSDSTCVHFTWGAPINSLSLWLIKGIICADISDLRLTPSAPQ